MTEAERIAQLERVLAALIDYLDVVGCYDRTGERLGDQVPAVQQARAVLGLEAWSRVMGPGAGEGARRARAGAPAGKSRP